MRPGCPNTKDPFIDTHKISSELLLCIDNWCLKGWPEAIRMFQKIAKKNSIVFHKIFRVIFYFVQIL